MEDLSIKGVVIKDGVTSIGEEAFYVCTALTDIVISANVDTIEPFTFGGCSSLEVFTIPDSVGSIGYSAFNSCSSLRSINIPESVEFIEYDAFYDCNSLTSIIIPDSITGIEEETFLGCDKLIIYCYADSYAETYAKENNIPFKVLMTSDIIRLSGQSRYETAIAISNKGWTSAETVLLANGLNYADALAGGVLATKLKTPLLLTHPSGATNEIKNYILKKDPANIYLLGGEGALSDSVIENIYA